MGRLIRALIVASMLAAIGCGGMAEPAAMVAGVWSGSWTTDHSTDGTMLIFLHQQGGELSGQANIHDSEIVRTGTVRGRVVGYSVSATVTIGKALHMSLTNSHMDVYGDVEGDHIVGGFTLAVLGYERQGTFDVTRDAAAGQSSAPGGAPSGQ